MLGIIALKVILGAVGVAGLISLNRQIVRRATKDIEGKDATLHAAQVRVMRCVLLIQVVLVVTLVAVVAGAPERVVMALYWLMIGLAVVAGVLWAVASEKGTGS